MENVCSYLFAAQNAQHVFEDVEEKLEEDSKSSNPFDKSVEHGEDSSNVFRISESLKRILLNHFLF